MLPDISPFVYMPQHRVVICCKYGRVAEEVLNHLNKDHPKITSTVEKDRIVQAIHGIRNIIRTQDDLKSFAFPPAEAARNPFLQDPRTDGFACHLCRYVTPGKNTIQSHYKHTHNWQNPRGKGSKSRKNVSKSGPEPWRSGVRYHKFFNTGRAHDWFEVEKSMEQSNNTANTARNAESFIQIILRQRVLFKSEKTRIEVMDAKLEPGGWLDRTEWHFHLAKFDKEAIRGFIAPDQEDEAVLQAIKPIFRQVAAQARRLSSARSIALSARFDIHRTHAEVKPRRPFESRMEGDSWGRYKEIWWQVLCYLFRTQAVDKDARPPYTLTTQQQRLYRHLRDTATTAPASPGREQTMHRVLTDLVVSILDHQIQRTQYESVLISALAAMGLREDGGWLAAENYTTKYSAVIKLARMFVIRQAMAEWQQQVDIGKEAGYPEDEARERATPVPMMIREKVLKFMVMSSLRTADNPMEWIYTTRSYGLTIRYTTAAVGQIGWSGNQISYQKIRFTMTELSAMMHQLAAEARTLMAKMLFIEGHKPPRDNRRRRRQQPDPSGPDGEEGIRITDKFPSIDWGRIEDDHSNDTQGYSFLTDSRHQWSVEGDGWLFSQMEADPESKARWIRPGEQPFKPEAVKAYSEWFEEFRKILFILIHMGSGMPARSTEITGIRYHNTIQGGIRNVFARDGRIFFVTLYHKGFRKSGEANIVYRFMPRDVGELFVWFLWLVLPFWQEVQGIVQGGIDTSPFVWSDNVVRVPDQEDADTNSSQAVHAAIDEPSASQTTAAEDADEDWEEELTVKYGTWSSDRVRRILKHYTGTILGAEINIQAWRQIAVAIRNRYLKPKGQPNMVNPEDEDEDEDDVMEASIDQTAHTSHIDGMIYGRLLQQGDFGTISKQDAHRKASILWHRVLQMDDRQDIPRSRKRRADTQEDEQDRMRARRVKMASHVDIHGQLQQMMGSNTEFRGNQKAVINAIMQGESPIIQIVGTGVGKSLSFMLPAYSVVAGVSIIVVPLITLRGDLKVRCKELGIDADIWTRQTSSRAASIVFVTPEAAVSRTFSDFINKLQEQRQLDRVIVDECHMVLDTHADGFRPRMRELGPVIESWGVQRVFLTATLMPSDEPEFFRAMRLVPKRVRMFRQRTTRPNIRYRVRNTAKPDIFKGVEDEVKQALAKQDGGKVIVFGKIEDVRALGAKLKCSMFYAAIGTTEEKDRIVQDWRQIGWLIVATNALGVGLDIPNIRTVIHIGSPINIRHYVQESGRGGRDGQPCDAVVVCPVVSSREREARARKGWKEYRTEWMVRYIDGTGCRRVVLDEAMDGRTDRIECEDGEEPCDHCTRERYNWDEAVVKREVEICTLQPIVDNMQTERERIRRREAERVRSDLTDEEHFVSLHREWHGCCVICRHGGEGEYRHTLQACPEEGSDRWVEATQKASDIWNNVFKAKRFQHFTGCFQCGWPQSICPSWEADKHDGGWFNKKPGGRCDVRILLDVVGGVCGIFPDKTLAIMEELMVTSGKEEADDKHGWMGRKMKVGQLETSNLGKWWFHCMIMLEEHMPFR